MFIFLILFFEYKLCFPVQSSFYTKLKKKVKRKKKVDTELTALSTEEKCDH